MKILETYKGVKHVICNQGGTEPDDETIQCELWGGKGLIGDLNIDCFEIRSSHCLYNPQGRRELECDSDIGLLCEYLDLDSEYGLKCYPPYYIASLKKRLTEEKFRDKIELGEY